MTVVSVRDLGYTINGVEILSSIGLEVDHGELIVVAGPNGAGKSTLLSIIAGDRAPTRGKALLNGVAPAHVPVARLAAMRAVFTPPEHDIAFVASEVVTFGRYPRGGGRVEDEGAVTAAMAATDTAHLAARSFATLSGGERTRVTIARVLAQEADLLLLDEPTTGLDVRHQELILSTLGVQAAAGAAVVAVLHDLNAAARYADRVILLGSGRVVGNGRPSTVLDEGVLSDLYQQPMRVVDHPFRDCPLVLTVD